jgi:hypothetical protein
MLESTGTRTLSVATKQARQIEEGWSWKINQGDSVRKDLISRENLEDLRLPMLYLTLMVLGMIWVNMGKHVLTIVIVITQIAVTPQLIRGVAQIVHIVHVFHQ